MWGEDDTLLLSESTVILYPRLGGGDGEVQLILTVSTPVCSVVRLDGGSPVLRWLKKVRGLKEYTFNHKLVGHHA